MKHDPARADNLTTSLLGLSRRVEEGEEKVNRLNKVTALLERVAAKIEEPGGKEGGEGGEGGKGGRERKMKEGGREGGREEKS